MEAVPEGAWINHPTPDLVTTDHITQQSVDADVGDRRVVERERDYWMNRARRAEAELRRVSIWVSQIERGLKQWKGTSG